MTSPWLPEEGLCRYFSTSSGNEGAYHWGWLRGRQVAHLEDAAVASVLRHPGRYGLRELEHLCAASPSLVFKSAAAYCCQQGCLSAPLGNEQEVWAAGVTYESSKLARMAESAASADNYARVYGAERPELFLKATRHRVVSPGNHVAVRADSHWTVPEPELALLIAGNGEILGYTIGNDMSARDIEGENPLYLPQAKIYAGCCAVGPVVVPADSLDPVRCTVTMLVLRDHRIVFEGAVCTDAMRRTPEELRDWLFRDNSFPAGVLLLTGTGIVPPDDFALAAGDEIRISITGLGELHNGVAKSEHPRETR